MAAECEKSGIIVGLDFGGTLEGSAISPKVQRWDFYRKAGYEFHPEALKQAHLYAREQILATPNRQSWSIAITTERWFFFEAEYLGLEISLARKWASQHARERLLHLTEARSAILDMSLEYELALISNNIGNLDRVLSEAGLRSAFRIIVDSSECGYRKPDPKIFHVAQERAGIVRSSDCWYLGDKYDNDVVGALRAGWNAAWLVKCQHDWEVPPGVLIVSSLEEFHNELNKRY